MSYQILTDSCCDLTRQQYRQYGLSPVPMTVTYDGESHRNFTDPVQVQAFYDRLRSGTQATTAATNPQDWTMAMEPVLAAGQDVLVLVFSSALSTSCQSACMAAADLREAYPQRTIHVVDTLCASLGQGLLVDLACRKQAEGMDLDSLAAWVEETKLHICHWVTVDDLNHLKRGGRINTATAIMGTMLNVKPILHMDSQGRLIHSAKVRGRKCAVDYLLQKFRETAADRSLVYIGHGDCPEEAAILEQRLKEEYGVSETHIAHIGPVIGAHTGPGVLTLFFQGTHR